MPPKTIYEAAHASRAASDSAISFGRITAVKPASRLCTVKTFFSTNPAVNDQHIENCQWLSMDSNPAGDEATSVPRAGSIGMVIHVGGEPYIFGFIKGLNNKGQAITGKEVAKLTEGDKVISTQGGNYITVKANRSIEIKSKETLRTLYFPTKSLLQHFCRSYELKADGGFQKWDFDDVTGSTKWEAVYRNNQAATAFVLEQKGDGDGGMYRLAVGPGNGNFGNIFCYEQTISAFGEVKTTIGPPGVAAYTHTIKPDGSFLLQNGSGQGLTVSVDLVGGVAITVGPLVAISLGVAGDIAVSAPGGTITLAAAGDLEVQALGKGKLVFLNEVEIQSLGDVKLTTLGACTVSAASGIKLDGIGGQGAGAMFGVLTFPNVINPVTGTPLGPGSTTVLASI